MEISRSAPISAASLPVGDRDSLRRPVEGRATGGGIISRDGTLYGVRLLALLLTFALSAVAAAQELSSSVTYCATITAGDAPGCGGTSLSLAVSGVRSGGSTVALRLRVTGSDEPAVPAVVGQLGFGVSANETFGPLGNVVFELAGDLRSDGLAQGTIGARGVLGPVAARLSVGMHGAAPVVFDPLGIAGDELPVYGAAGPTTSLRLGLTGRPSRNVIIEADPELYLTSAGTAGRLAARLRLLRTLGENELQLLLRGGATPGFAEGYGAVGVGLLLPRGRAPDVSFAVHLGHNGASFAPGVSANYAENLAGGVRLGLDAALEPYRRDVAPGRLAADLSLPLADGRLGFELAGAYWGQDRASGLALRASFVTPLTLP